MSLLVTRGLGYEGMDAVEVTAGIITELTINVNQTIDSDDISVSIDADALSVRLDDVSIDIDIGE